MASTPGSEKKQFSLVRGVDVSCSYLYAVYLSQQFPREKRILSFEKP